MDITRYQAEGAVPVTVLQPHGDLDASNYKSLITAGEAVRFAGVEDVVLDLGDVPYMSSSGVVALNSLARMLRGQTPPDVEGGWSALHDIEKNVKQGVHPHLKLAGVRPAVDKVLTTVGFKAMFEVYDDVPAAVASFQG
jgi:hypothetical protein